MNHNHTLLEPIVANPEVLEKPDESLREALLSKAESSPFGIFRNATRNKDATRGSWPYY